MTFASGCILETSIRERAHQWDLGSKNNLADNLLGALFIFASFF
jgi:hypothetical protein